MANIEGAWEDITAGVKAGQLPDTIGPFKTGDILGVSLVAASALLTYLMVARKRKRRSGKK